MTMREILAYFPHRCAGVGCAVCRWVRERDWRQQQERLRVKRSLHE